MRCAGPASGPGYTVRTGCPSGTVADLCFTSGATGYGGLSRSVPVWDPSEAQMPAKAAETDTRPTQTDNVDRLIIRLTPPWLARFLPQGRGTIEAGERAPRHVLDSGPAEVRARPLAASSQRQPSAPWAFQRRPVAFGPHTNKVVDQSKRLLAERWAEAWS